MSIISYRCFRIIPSQSRQKNLESPDYVLCYKLIAESTFIISCEYSDEASGNQYNARKLHNVILISGMATDNSGLRITGPDNIQLLPRFAVASSIFGYSLVISVMTATLNSNNQLIPTILRSINSYCVITSRPFDTNKNDRRHVH